MVKLFRYLPCAMITGLALLSSLFVQAQQLSNEPAGGMEESIKEDASLLSREGSRVLPAELDTYPLNDYYKTWDTLCVRRYSDVLNPLNDSVVLRLETKGRNNFIFPREGQLLSPYGYRGRRVHAGVDIKLNLRDSVGSAFDGVVRMARWYSGYGNCVVVRHYNGLETLYGHLSKIIVKVNQPVTAGEIIGLGGHTGRATCNHLHFETRFQGVAFNPKQLIDFDNYKLKSDSLIITNRTFGRSRDYLPGNSELIASTDKKSNYKTRSPKKFSGSMRYHTIKKGDTLYALSRKYDIPVKQICALNHIKPTKTLKLGTKVRVK